MDVNRESYSQVDISRSSGSRTQSAMHTPSGIHQSLQPGLAGLQQANERTHSLLLPLWSLRLQTRSTLGGIATSMSGTLNSAVTPASTTLNNK